MTDDFTNQTLVTRARAGDTAAFASLIRSVDEEMRGVVYHVLGSKSAMDDVLQDAYLKAFKSIESFRGEARFGTWLYRIVHTTCIDHVRAKPKADLIGSGDEFDSAALQATGGTDVAQMVSDRRDLQLALAELSPNHYAVVALVDGEGRSYEDVAELLAINPGTVASRLNRARTELRELLAYEYLGANDER